MWWWPWCFFYFDWTAPMNEPFKADQVIHLPPRRRLSPHAFGAPVNVPADPHLGLLEQTERTCAACGVVKVTVHGADGTSWREWRRIHGGSQFRLNEQPACEPPFGDAPR